MCDRLVLLNVVFLGVRRPYTDCAELRAEREAGINIEREAAASNAPPS